MGRDLIIVHYLNQFFGGLGGEEKASEGPLLKEGAAGPGRLLQDGLKGRGMVKATIICGDNYFTENTDRVLEKLIQLITPFHPDLLIAGPAFNAGRYGVACGALCKAFQDKTGIPAVTGMCQENPGVELFRKDVYIVKTADSAKGMSEAIPRMTALGLKIVSGEKIGKPEDEGYIPRGILKCVISDRTATERAVDMLLSKLKGEPFETELQLPRFERIKPAASLKDISSARIALVTDGGLVPAGNPANVERVKATRFGSYETGGSEKLEPEKYEVVHVGYDTGAVSRDPNRLVPLDIMRDLEKKGMIGSLCDSFYSTTGVATPLDSCKAIGRGIVERLKAEKVDGVILSST